MVVLCVLQVFGSSSNEYNIIGKKGRRFQLCPQFWASGSRCGNGPNGFVHRAGPPFLDNHYRGYQLGKNSIVQIQLL